MNLFASIKKNSLALGLFAMLTASLLAATYLLTKERIALSQRQSLEKALFEVLPKHEFDNDILLDTLPIPASATHLLGHVSDAHIYVARQQGRASAVIIPAITAAGYSGDIHLLAAIRRDGSISGVRVLAHKETPGLGDKIERAKSPWIERFDGLSLAQYAKEHWQVKKYGGKFDQFTGATITPQAVVRQVHQVLRFVEQHHSELFALEQP